MYTLRNTLCVLAVTSALILTAWGGVAQSISGAAERSAELDQLYIELREANAEASMRIEDRIWKLWSQSGSASADLLLERGNAALQADDLDAAIEHFTALTDHAPEFAEGWNARATAFYLIGEYGLSMADIQRVLALNPHHFGALTGLGSMLEELGDKKNALAAFRLAHEIHPNREGIAEAVARLTTQVDGTNI